MVKPYLKLLLMIIFSLNWIFSQRIDSSLPIATIIPAATPLQTAPILDSQEMEQFFDQTIPEQLSRYQIPGATVSVVKDGKLFFAKGYGLADVEKKIPVDAERTLFRIGSTSKLFTWTAVMQLVEQGKLDLDRDVNTYLRAFQIPATYPQPVTLRHLMTHTAGFEERGLGEKAKEPGTPQSLQEYLIHYMPARALPPGQLTAYSNYGTALAGYIVAVVSELPFEAYVEENIFRPLGMEHSTFRQDIPAGLANDLAIGYSTSNGSLDPELFEYFNSGPEGAMSSTALDMARFMIAHLQDGRYGEVRILQPETAKEMHQRQFANDPRLNGFALGFFDLTQNQQHILEHGGGTDYFHTQLALLPEQNLGIFISYNGSTGITAVGETFQAFLDHYYPVEKIPTTAPITVSPEEIARFSGQYRSTRFNYTTIERVSYISGTGFGQVTVNPDGSLFIDFEPARGPFSGTYVQVEPLVFQELNGSEKLIFQTDSSGNITNLLIDSMPHFAWQKISLVESARFSQALLLACLVVFLSVPLTFIGELVRTHRKPSITRWAAFGTCLLALVLIAGYLFTLGSIPYGIPVGLRILLAISLDMPLLAGLLVVLAGLVWARGKWSLVSLIHYSLIAAAAVAFVWLLNEWNLLGFRL